MAKQGGPYRAASTQERIAPDRRRRNGLLLCGLGLVTGALVAFVGPSIATALATPPPPFQIKVYVESDRLPVEGALVLRNQHVVALTQRDGRGVVTISGSEGEFVDLSVRCPAQFDSQPKTVNVRLIRLADNRIPEYEVSCTPRIRHVVVGVKAEGGANLPIVYLSKTVARTDASGAASFAVEAAPGTHLQVTLDTSERPDLSPENPTRLFVVGQKDEMMVFDQKFEHQSPSD